MIYLENPPVQSRLMDDFDWEVTKEATRENRRTQHSSLYYLLSDGFKQLKRTIRQGVRVEIELLKEHARPGAVLDLGCGGGNVLQHLPEQFIPFGIEPSPGLCEKAHQFAVSRGGAVRQGVTIPTIRDFESRQFSAVIARSYLEHEVHADEVCRECLRVLHPGGILLVKVPNARCLSSMIRGSDWPGVRLPDHVNYFRPKDLRRLADQVGFSELIMPPSHHLPTSDNMWAILVK